MLNQILQSLGHNPTDQTEERTTYRSPFNVSERTPSFCVFPNRAGEWKNFKDHANGMGGDVYKFVMNYFQIGFVDAKAKITELTGRNEHNKEHNNEHNKEHNRTNKPPLFSSNQAKENSYKIIKTQQLQNKALIDYLKEDRGLVSIDLRKYVGEVYYEIESKRYFAISFLNDKGGREVRNKYFKGSFDKKDISRIFPNPNDKRVKIFEGFIDFLSYLEINKNAPLSNYLILNSVSLKEKGLRVIQGNFEAVELYLDNDKAGNEATQFFIDNLNNVVDKRVYYKEYKDLNEYLLNGER